MTRIQSSPYKSQAHPFYDRVMKLCDERFLYFLSIWNQSSTAQQVYMRSWMNHKYQTSLLTRMNNISGIWLLKIPFHRDTCNSMASESGADLKPLSGSEATRERKGNQCPLFFCGNIDPLFTVTRPRLRANGKAAKTKSLLTSTGHNYSR